MRTGEDIFFDYNLNLDKQTVSFSPDGRYLVRTAIDKVWVYNSTEFELISEYETMDSCPGEQGGYGHTAKISGVSFSLNSDYFRVKCKWHVYDQSELFFSLPHSNSTYSSHSSNQSGAIFHPYSMYDLKL